MPEARTEWRTPIGCLIIIGHFPPKSPIISGSFAERDLHLEVFYACSTFWIGVVSLKCGEQVSCQSNVAKETYKSPKYGKRDLQSLKYGKLVSCHTNVANSDNVCSPLASKSPRLKMNCVTTKKSARDQARCASGVPWKLVESGNFSISEMAFLKSKPWTLIPTP